MPILSRYMLRSYLPTFGLALGVFLFVLLMQHFLRLFNLALMKGIPLVWIGSCFARLLPGFLTMALPVAFLVALLLTLGQLSETGEVMAMRAAGFSFREMLVPFLGVAVLLSALLFVVNHELGPKSFHSFREAQAQAASRLARVELEPRTYFPLGDWRFYAEDVDSDGTLAGVRLVKLRGKYQRLRISARSGRARLEQGRGLTLELFSGTLEWPNLDPTSVTTGVFGRYKLFVPFAAPIRSERELDLQELSTARVREALRRADLPDSRRREYATEAATRSAGAAAPFVLFWIACPLGLLSLRRGRAAGFALSLLVMFVFYGLLAFGIGVGRRMGGLSAWGPWLPNVVVLVTGAAFWRKLTRI
ncbi:MAG: LptF/LptG family permease [Elusimicrobiota bacterium]|jgi:lipopolysaccharide export system permease protein